MKKAVIIILLLLFCTGAYALQLGSKIDAGNAINQSYEIMREMAANNFSTTYVNDVLLEAERVYKQVRYVEILNNLTSAGTTERKAAKEAAELVDLRGITYNNVIELANEIKSRRQQAFILYDQINLAKADVIEYYGEDYKIKENESTAVKSLVNAEISFYQDRYAEVEPLLQTAKSRLEFEKSLLATINTMTENSKNFVRRNWIYIIVFLAILGTAGWFFYKKARHHIIKRKIAKMHTESKVIMILMKKAQSERFNENKISGLIYDIRMKKYNERLREIRQELPVLEKMLRKERYTHKHNKRKARMLKKRKHAKIKKNKQAPF